MSDGRWGVSVGTGREGGCQKNWKCKLQFSNSGSRQSLLVSHLLRSQFILWWRELPKSGAGDRAMSQTLPTSPPPSKHRLLPRRSFNQVQYWGFQILCETDFDCRRLLQTSLNGLFVDPFESRRRSSDILFISTILTPEHEDRTFIWRYLWLLTI